MCSKFGLFDGRFVCYGVACLRIRFAIVKF